MINIKYTKKKYCEYCKAVNNLKWGYMSDGMPYGIQQQQPMHRHALTKYILFIVADGISLIYQVKLTDFTIIPNFFGRISTKPIFTCGCKSIDDHSNGYPSGQISLFYYKLQPARNKG
jgi:hypothetical protein